MIWQGLQRRLPLPLLGCILGTGACLVVLHPAVTEAALSSGYTFIWNSNSAQAISPLLSALRLDPGSPERWSDLAEAMYEEGRDSDARYCVEQAMSRAPGLPHIAMRSAGMYFRLGDNQSGLRLTHRVITETREYDPNIFQTWQRMGGTTAEVFSLGVGSSQTAGRDYFRFLLDSGDTAAIDSAWPVLQTTGMATVDQARFYAEFLTTSQKYRQAARIESEILPSGLWNDGFESDWTGRGLDWNVQSLPGMTVIRDTTTRYRGKASLSIAFDGSSRNAFDHVTQVRVVSDGNWRIRAMMKLETNGALASRQPGAKGLHLRVVDGETSAILAETASVKANSGWIPLEAGFSTYSGARPVRIELVRPAESSFDLPLAGTAWLDDVNLTPIPSTQEMQR